MENGRYKVGRRESKYTSIYSNIQNFMRKEGWEHEQYLEARKRGTFNPKEQQEKQEKPMEECEFLGEESPNYLKIQKDKNENIRLYELDAFAFMMMDLDEMEKKMWMEMERK